MKSSSLARASGALFALLLLATAAPAQDPDPEALDAWARERPGDALAMRQGLEGWLGAAAEALGAEDWSLAISQAERAWMLYQLAEESHPDGGFERHASMIRMALAKGALNTGQEQYAADLYRQAAGYYPDPRSRVSAGRIAARMEEWHQARRDYEEALRLDGVAPSTWLHLAEALYHLGETERAIEAVEEGTRAGADGTHASRLLARFQREAEVEEGYARGGTLHFAVTWEDGAAQQDFLRRVESSLERVYERVCRFLDTYPRNRVPVVVYPSTNAYQSASGAPTWTAAVYNGKIRIPTGDLAEGEDEHLDRIVAHEFAHYLIERLAGKGAPAWLQEGLAQQVEADGEAPSWIPGYMRRLLSAYRGKDFAFSVRQLEGSFHGQSGGGVQAAYAVSYYVVGYLLESGGMFRLHNLMEALKQGTPVEDALYRELFLDYARLDEKWRAYAARELGTQ